MKYEVQCYARHKLGTAQTGNYFFEKKNLDLLFFFHSCAQVKIQNHLPP